jgi:hypothetical protein
MKGQKMATKTSRRRPDQFSNPKDYGDPIADGIHHAIKPLDKIATDMELKWGCDRLPSLVSPATAAKFGSAKAKLDDAIMSNNLEYVTKRVTVMMKGYKALDKEAMRAGNVEFHPTAWNHTTEKGFKFCIAQGNADAIKAIQTHPHMEGVSVYSLDEIGRLLESDSMTLVNSVKETFPDSEVTKIKKPKADLDQDLPW